MKHHESFTWIGPFTSDDCGGVVARGFADGLARKGAVVGRLDTGTGTVAPDMDLDQAVRAGDTTVVRQGPLSQLPLTTSIVAPGAGARDVVYTFADVAEVDPRARALLESCNEVWAPSFGQSEILAALGVARSKLRVVVPGAESGLAHRSQSRTKPPRVLFIGASAPERDDLECVTIDEPVGSRAFRAELARADAVVLAVDPDPYASTVLEVLASGKWLASVRSGAALEHAGTEQCSWFDPADPRDVERTLDELAKRCTLRAESGRSSGALDVDSAAALLIARADRPRTLAPERLDLVLADLGIPTTRERLAGSRANMRIVPVDEVEGSWNKRLAKELRRVDSETTIVLWVDETIEAETDRIAARAEAEIGAAGRDPEGVDVLVVTAPLAHAPRE